MGNDERDARRKELDPSVLASFAETFLPTFAYYPQQQSDGAYRAIYQPFTLDLVAKHVQGFVTIGAYALNENNLAKWLCFDADDAEQWAELKTLTLRLAEHGLPSYLEQSRRGGHLWLFFEESLPGQDVRRLGRHLLQEQKLSIKEIYPRQDELTTGVGSLVRLPFGIHRKSRRRYGFVTLNEQSIAPTVRDQLAILSQPERIPIPYIRRILASLPTEPPRPIPKTLNVLYPGDARHLSERIKQAIPVRDFVSQFVDLDERGRGLCPFHDDHRQSFGVHERENFWSCFAQCGEKPHGGSVIHFWQKMRRDVYGLDGDFVPTITELAKILHLER